jgi:hypothetical protein
MTASEPFDGSRSCFSLNQPQKFFVFLDGLDRPLLWNSGNHESA